MRRGEKRKPQISINPHTIKIVMPRILVTGGAGFIGSSLAEKLAADKNNSIIILDDLTTGTKSKIPTSKHKNIQFIKCDVNDWKDISGIMYSHPLDYIFHYAAVVGVKRTLDHPVKCIEGP